MSINLEVLDEPEDKIVKEWRPFKRQEDFARIPFSVFEALYGGAVGGGKSDVLIMLPLLYAFHRHPLFHGILFRRTFPQLEASLISRARDKWFRPLILAGVCSYNESKHVFTFQSGAKLRFGYMEQDTDARQHDTNQYHYVGLDEASQFSEFQIRFIMSRIRTETRDLPALMRMASNPGGPSHVFLRDRFVKPCPTGYTILKEKVGVKNGEAVFTKRIYIPAKLTDNPHLMEEDPDYINRLQLLPEGEREAKISGDWFAFSGQVFTEFRDRHVSGEPDNAIHVVPPFEIPDWWPKVLSIDWGFSAKTVCHVAAISPDDRLIIFKEYAKKGVLISTWASEIAQMVQYVKNLKQPIELDPSAWQKRGDEKTIEEQFRKHSGLQCRKADNDRISGKLLVHEYLRWEKKPPKYIPLEGYDQDKSDRILRLYGLKAQEQYRSLFEPEEEEKNLPKLVIFNTCTDLIEAIKQCQYKEAKDGLPVEDVAEFNGDDSYDNLRYLLKGTRRYFEECAVENSKRREMGVLLEKTVETNDWNSYAINVKRIEKEYAPTEPVKRARSNASLFR